MQHPEKQLKNQRNSPVDIEARVVRLDDSLQREISKLTEDLTDFRRYYDESRTERPQSQSDDIVNLEKRISKHDKALREARENIKLSFIRIQDQHEHSSCMNTKISRITKNQYEIEDRISGLEKVTKIQSDSIHDFEVRLVVLDEGFMAHSSQLGKDLEEIRQSQAVEARGKLEERIQAVEKRFAQIDALMTEVQGESTEQLCDGVEISDAVEEERGEGASEKDKVDSESDVVDEVLELSGQPLENEGDASNEEHSLNNESREESNGEGGNSVEAAPKALERPERTFVQDGLPAGETVDLGETYSDGWRRFLVFEGGSGVWRGGWRLGGCRRCGILFMICI